MITTRVDVRDTFGEVTDEIRRRSLQALELAAQEGKTVADQAAEGVTRFYVVHPRGDLDGFVAGIKAASRLVNIFDKGSLGKRTARLKHPDRRKPEWEVHRKGANPYVAHRREITADEGIAPRRITTLARAAGRRALLAALRR